MKTAKYFLWPVGERVQLTGAGNRWHGLTGAVVGHVRLDGVKSLAVRLDDGSGLTVISHPENVMSRELQCEHFARA
jgi:hypothetical protein